LEEAASTLAERIAPSAEVKTSAKAPAITAATAAFVAATSAAALAAAASAAAFKGTLLCCCEGILLSFERVLESLACRILQQER
jgi:hypothetical protein